MKKNKTKVLVLLDLKANTNEILNYTAKLAELIDADFEFFSVKKPTEVVNTDSQLSAMRIINKDYIQTTNELKNIVKLLGDNFGANVKTSFAIGNIKAEIENRLNSVKPAIVILGERKSKPLNFIGDNITNILSQKQDIKVLVASKNSSLNILKDIPLNLVSNKQRTVVA